MSFLQLPSSSASQEVTYHCKNSVAVFDAESKSFRHALRHMTVSDTELNARGNNKFRYRIMGDGSKVGYDRVRFLNIIQRHVVLSNLPHSITHLPRSSRRRRTTPGLNGLILLRSHRYRWFKTRVAHAHHFSELNFSRTVSNFEK